MDKLQRRDFLATAAGAATCLSGLGVGLLADDRNKTPVPRPPQVPLGKTGITLSRVGQGTGMSGGNRQSNHTRKGFEKLVSLFRHGYDRGVTFFDLADLYGSHVYFREALRFIPREKINILTKLWWRYDGRDPKKVAPEYQRKSAESALERFRHEIATDYLDIVLLHCMTTESWDTELAAYMDVFMEAKEKKKIRALGVSCHNHGALKKAADTPWVDVVLARINPYGVKMDGTVDEIVATLRKIKANGKAIIGMKIYGEGQLADKKDECIKFAQNLGLLDTMTIGAETPEQLDETLRLIGKYPAAKVG